MPIQDKIKRILLPQHTASEVFLASVLGVFAYLLVYIDKQTKLENPFIILVYLITTLVISSFIIFISKSKTKLYFLKLVNILGTVLLLLISVLYVSRTLHNFDFSQIKFYHYFFFLYAFIVIIRFIIMISLLFGSSKFSVFQKAVSILLRQIPYAKYNQDLKPQSLIIITLVSIIILAITKNQIFISLGQSLFSGMILLDLFSFKKDYEK